VHVRQFLLILLARKKIVLATLLATVLLNYQGADPPAGLTMPGQQLPRYLATQIDDARKHHTRIASVGRMAAQLAGGGAEVVGSVVMEF
jgi:hypothetical protein